MYRKRKQKSNKFNNAPSISSLLKKAEKVFNAYIRYRDSNNGEASFTCISCGITFSSTYLHAGHYLPAGLYSTHKFNVDNVNGQCEFCNTGKHGNQEGYRAGLINKIGTDRVLLLESTCRNSQKWDREDLLKIITHYSQCC